MGRKDSRVLPDVLEITTLSRTLQQSWRYKVEKQLLSLRTL